MQKQIGVTRGGLSTKIHAMADGWGNPVYIQLSAGHISDTALATEILSHAELKGTAVLADKAYGSAEIRHDIPSHDAVCHIPPKSNAAEPWNCDGQMYKERHLAGCFFQKIKLFRRAAARYDKLASRFLSFVLLASIMVLVK